MRTVRISLKTQLDATQEVIVETEVMVEEDPDSQREAGKSAMATIREVFAGMADEA